MSIRTMACTSRNRSSNWTERDKILVVQLILDQEEELYGKLKGCQRGATAKKKAWEALEKNFNAEADEARSADQIKKCFENLRSYDPDMNNNLAVLCSLTGNVEPEPVPAPPRIDEEPGTSASVPVIKLSQGTLEQDDVPRQTPKPTKRKATSEVLLEEEIKRARAERRKFFGETKLMKQQLQQERELHLLQLKAMQTSSQH